MAIDRGTGATESKRPRGHLKRIGKGSASVAKTADANAGLAEDDPGYVPSARPLSQSSGRWEFAGRNDGHPMAQWHEAGVPGNQTHATAQQSYANSTTDPFGKIGGALKESASAGRARARRQK